MNIISTIFGIVIFLNSILAIFTVFREKERDIAAIWAWLLVIIMLPGFGYIIYMFLGRKISKEKIFNIRSQERIGMEELVESQKELIESENLDVPESNYQDKTFELIQLFLNGNESVLTKGNKVKLIHDGKDKFNQLLDDISKAKDHIHVTYYIFRGDDIGTKLVKALEERAKQGVEVNVLYDPRSESTR